MVVSILPGPGILVSSIFVTYVGGVAGRGVITMTGERGGGPDYVTGGLPFIRSEAKHLGFKTGEQEVVFGCPLEGGGDFNRGHGGTRPTISSRWWCCW